MSDQEAEEREDGDEEVAKDEETGAFDEGDFVKLAYTARSVEDETLVDTTDPEVVEEEGIDHEGQTFEPRTIVLGAGHIFPPVEDEILTSDVGDEGTVVVPAAEAFGEFHEHEVRTVSADKIPDDDRYPGARVEIDGQHGYVETIIGKRARIDFNHPLAGEDIEYEFKILEQITDRVEKAKSLLSAYLNMDLDMHIETDEVEEEQLVESDDEDEDDEDEDEDAEPETELVTVEKETLYVESTPQLAFNQQWMFQKQQIAQEMMERVDVDRVVIQEIIDGSGGMMPGMGGMMGGFQDLAAEDVDEADLGDVDAEEIVEELSDE